MAKLASAAGRGEWGCIVKFRRKLQLRDRGSAALVGRAGREGVWCLRRLT